MKILVLMPLDEKSVYMAMGIYKGLPHELQDKCFCMPVFMDYLVQTKLVENWGYALFDTLLAAKKIYEVGEDDLIIIGNTDKNYKFDAIFNFQDIEEDLPFKDEFAAKVKDLVQSEEVLAKLINNLYDNKDSIMPLHNCLATADFLSAYIKTDPGLDKLKTEYQKKLENLNGQYHSA